MVGPSVGRSVDDVFNPEKKLNKNLKKNLKKI